MSKLNVFMHSLLFSLSCAISVAYAEIAAVSKDDATQESVNNNDVEANIKDESTADQPTTTSEKMPSIQLVDDNPQQTVEYRPNHFLDDAGKVWVVLQPQQLIVYPNHADDPLGFKEGRERLNHIALNAKRASEGKTMLSRSAYRAFCNYQTAIEGLNTSNVNLMIFDPITNQQQQLQPVVTQGVNFNYCN